MSRTLAMAYDFSRDEWTTHQRYSGRELWTVVIEVHGWEAWQLQEGQPQRGHKVAAETTLRTRQKCHLSDLLDTTLAQFRDLADSFARVEHGTIRAYRRKRG